MIRAKLFTSDRLLRPPFREDVEILKGHHDPLYVPKHGGQSKTEEHDEEQDRPERRDRHLGDGFCEHDEGQTSSLHTLLEDNDSPSGQT